MSAVINAPIHRIGHDGIASASVFSERFGHQQVHVFGHAFEPAVSNEQTGHRRAMPVVVVGVAVSVDEIPPTDQIDAFKVGVFEGNT